MTLPIDQISNLTALVVGDVMIDAYLWGDVNRQSPEAPVPVLLKSGKDSRIGGAGNVARNILAMGAKAHLATVIGNDISGKYLIYELRHVMLDGKSSTQLNLIRDLFTGEPKKEEDA